MIAYGLLHMPVSVLVGWELTSTITTSNSLYFLVTEGPSFGIKSPEGTGFITMEMAQKFADSYSVTSNANPAFIITNFLLIVSLAISATLFHQRRDFIISFILSAFLMEVTVSNIGNNTVFVISIISSIICLVATAISVSWNIATLFYRKFTFDLDFYED
ncbi:hypothetical protein AYI68_g2863 [Smittium mucronatum]|uniref:Uncharacterized protein n=1 Tax=Smittium mucronatum TaxID=133383 RepID=A0A1R0H1L6_9FUNG|nr:hypothetical protein AYI68_g2863 [Smittium mucronatum]